MDTFEEPENPFDTDDNRNLSSQASSSTKLNISEPSSPPQTVDDSLPTPSYGAFPQQQKADHWLQSSDDVEILVRSHMCFTPDGGDMHSHHRYYGRSSTLRRRP